MNNRSKPKFGDITNKSPFRFFALPMAISLPANLGNLALGKPSTRLSSAAASPSKATSSVKNVNMQPGSPSSQTIKEAQADLKELRDVDLRKATQARENEVAGQLHVVVDPSKRNRKDYLSIPDPAEEGARVSYGSLGRR
jgi:hypothetical protein